MIKMSYHSLTARGTDLPFSDRSVVSITHGHCNKTAICRQLFAGELSANEKGGKNTSNYNSKYLILCNFFHAAHCGPVETYFFDIV